MWFLGLFFGAWRTADARSWKIQGESVWGGRINRTRFLRCWFFVTRRVQFIYIYIYYVYIHIHQKTETLIRIFEVFFLLFVVFFTDQSFGILVDVASWVQMGRSWSKREVMGNIPSQSLTWLTWKWHQKENRDSELGNPSFLGSIRSTRGGYS